MATATARLTAGSVFGLVTTTANTVSETLGAIGSAVGMATAYVENAATEQRKRIMVDSLSFDRKLAAEHAQEAAARNAETMKFLAANPDQKDFYASSYDEVMNALSKLSGEPAKAA